MLQTGSSLGSGTASVAQDAADETVAHAEDAAQQVCFKISFSQQLVALMHCTSRLLSTSHSDIQFHFELFPSWPFMHAHLTSCSNNNKKLLLLCLVYFVILHTLT